MKNYLFLSAVGAMLLAACSDDKVPLEGPEVAQSGSELTISLLPGGDGMSTRAARPVNSSEAANNVTAVRLYVYDSTGADVTSTALATGTQNPMPWSGPTDTGTPGTAEHKFSKTIKLNKLSSDGQYTVVGYGYNLAADYTVSGGTTASTPFTATPLSAAAPAELFAGKAIFNVTNGNINAGTNSEVILKRHVAGLLGYFKNVPILYPDPNNAGLPTVVAFVRVYASGSSSTFTFPSATVGNVNGNSDGTSKNLVMEFDISALLTSAVFGTQTAAALLNNDLTMVFNIPAIASGGVQTVPNSVLKGRFLIPFNKVAGATTFTVELQGTTGNVLKSWNIVNNASADKKVYDIQRNYFYSIGQKVKAGSTDGGTPDPGTTGDDDAPIDLSQETVITITVNDAWDMIYNLGLE